MATRVLGPTGSRRRRRFLFVSMLLVACTALFLAGSAQAVHDLKFQLDGDVSTTAYSAPDATQQVYDWGQNPDNTTTAQTDPGHGLFHVTTTGGTQTVTPNSDLVPSVDSNGDPIGCAATPAGCTFDAASFQRDFLSGPNKAGCSLTSSSTGTFCTSDDTTYATGSKDTLGIGNGGWQCNHDSNVTSKIDIMNSYVATYHNADGDLIEYFGMEKNVATGTNDVGVWFLQGPAECTAPSGHHNFTKGAHRNGDVLVVSEFSNGGGVSTIKAFRWAASTDPSSPFFGDGGCIDSKGNYNPAGGPVTSDKGCDGQSFGSGQDCKTVQTPPSDLLCATTNAAGLGLWNQNVTTPWLTANGSSVGNTLIPPDFYEGAINITQVFKQSSGGTTAPRCFTVGVPDTRSSASVTATLFDYTINQIGSCSTSLSTSAGQSDPPITGEVNPPANIGTGVVSSGTDTAQLTIKGTSTWGGTLTWYLCGPVASDACDKHGVQVTSRTVSDSSAASDFVSDAAFLTSAGRYCWFAHFEPDGPSAAAGVSPADGGIANECFTVAKVTPNLATQATCRDDQGNLVTGDCVLGVNTLRDTATLSNTASQPGTTGPGGDTGSFKSIYLTDPTSVVSPADSNITWHLYKPASGGCTTDATGFPTTRAVSGDGTYPKTAAPDNQPLVQYKPVLSDGVGTYTFVASYPADSANMNAATGTACPDTSGTEKITLIGSAASSSDQRWLPNDRVTLTTTGGTLTGTLTVTLYSGTPTVTNGVCTAGSATAISGQSYTFLPSAAASGTEFNTTNSTFYVGSGPAQIPLGTPVTYGAAGPYFWLVHYHDNNLTSPNDRCESSNVTITN